MNTLLSLFLVSFSVVANAQNYDVLLKKNLSLKTSNLEQVMSKTENNIKVFAENFNIRLDSKSKLIAGPEVTGTTLQPVYKASVKKCVFLFCQTIDIDAEFTLKKVSGQCNYNYQLKVNFERSSAMLAELYSSITTGLCFQKTKEGGVASVQVNLIHAPTYEKGTVQKHAYELISLQGESILESMKTVLKLNGVSEIR